MCRKFYLREAKGGLEIVALPDSFLQGKTQFWFRYKASLIFDEVKELHEVCLQEAFLYNGNMLVSHILIGDGCFSYYENGQLKNVNCEILKQVERLLAENYFPFLKP